MIEFLPDSIIESFIEEDVPYGDLTTHLLGIGNIHGRMVFSTREETTLCCTEEASRLLQKCGATRNAEKFSTCKDSSTQWFGHCPAVF